MISGLFPTASLEHFARRIALILAMLAFGILTVLAQPSKETREQIEAGRLEIGQIEAALQRDSLNDSRLADLRARIDPILVTIETIVQQEQPRADEIKARIEKLGPAPDAAKGGTESADVARDRAEQQKHWKELDDTLRLAQALALRANQAKEAIASRRLQNFTREILKQGDSVASPLLWINVAKGAPSDLRALRFLAAQWWEAILNNLTWYKIATLIGFAALLIFGAPRAWRWVLSGSWRKQQDGEDHPDLSKLAKALVAIRMVILSVLVPVVVLLLLQMLLQHFGLVPGRVESILDGFFTSLAMVVSVSGLALGILAPGQPTIRLLDMPNRMARELWRMIRLVAIISAVDTLVEAFQKAIVASLPSTVASKGVFAVLAAFAIMRGLRRAFSTGSGEAQPVLAGWLTWVRLGSWGMALMIFMAALLGFVSLADFLVGQALWITALGLVATLLLVLIEEFLGVGLSARGAFGRRVHLATGIATKSLDQLGVLGSGLARLILFTILGFLLLAPWGVDSSNLLGTVRAAFFGFQVGGVTISLSSIAIAIALFALGFLITRAIQNWLETRYLPHTGLDVGLRNSIRTIFGYIGTIISAMIALGQLGLSLEKLTIVAGALSVGIGFGLQSIVNNFVSGLILLWERPIRVGDYIVVGDEQGTVKRINVRATEIETFDRASLIIPNSEFISGRVKNWMHADRTARIIIPVNVAYDADPDEVKALLLEAALAHREVMSEPKPFVQFKNLGESGLDFELYCYVDVDARGPTRSELLFDIFRRLKDARIEIPYPTRRLEISGVPGGGFPMSGLAREK
jgi:potassium-dependent mechanosensitive channel